MKKVFVVAVILVGLTTFAQEKGKNTENLSLEQQTELLVKKMTLDLDLNEKQQNAIRPVLLEESKKREVQKAERKARKKNEEKVSKEKMFEMKSKALDNQLAIKEKMKSILTTDQMEKWETLKSDRKGKMKQKKEKMKSRE
jgi:hypothetical protein